MIESKERRCPVCGHIDDGEPQCTVCGAEMPRQIRQDPAGFCIRLVAYFVDSTILYVFFTIVTTIGLLVWNWGSTGTASFPDSPESFLEVNPPLSIPLLIFMIVVRLVYYTLFHAGSGQTPGKMLMRIRVVRTDGHGLSLIAAFLRWVGYLVSMIFFCLGFLWIGLSPSKRGWHDYLAGSKVIRLGPSRGRAAQAP